MHIGRLIAAVLPLAARAVNIIQANDDGWVYAGRLSRSLAVKC